MNYHRNYIKQTFSDGTIKEFDPLLTWEVHTKCGIYEIGFGKYQVGLLIKRKIGNWSRIKIKFFRLWRLTFYFKFGKTAPYNPYTGIEF